MLYLNFRSPRPHSVPLNNHLDIVEASKLRRLWDGRAIEYIRDCSVFASLQKVKSHDVSF